MGTRITPLAAPGGACTGLKQVLQPEPTLRRFGNRRPANDSHKRPKRTRMSALRKVQGAHAGEPERGDGLQTGWIWGMKPERARQ